MRRTVNLKAAFAVFAPCFFSSPKLTYTKINNINMFSGVFFVWNTIIVFNIHNKTSILTNSLNEQIFFLASKYTY